MTYSGRGNKVDELFIPLKGGTSPTYYKGNDGKAYLCFDLDEGFFSVGASALPSAYARTISPDFIECPEETLKIRSKVGSSYNPRSISAEMKINNAKFRKNFSYIKGATRLWYLKRVNLDDDKVINLCDMTLIMAAMHRISEIARYKPEQLNRLMKSKENWLLHEFISQALDQFIDELAAEITKQDIMCVGNKA